MFFFFLISCGFLSYWTVILCKQIKFSSNFARFLWKKFWASCSYVFVYRNIKIVGLWCIFCTRMCCVNEWILLILLRNFEKKCEISFRNLSDFAPRHCARIFWIFDFGCTDLWKKSPSFRKKTKGNHAKVMNIFVQIWFVILPDWRGSFALCEVESP